MKPRLMAMSKRELKLIEEAFTKDKPGLVERRAKKFLKDIGGGERRPEKWEYLDNLLSYAEELMRVPEGQDAWAYCLRLGDAAVDPIAKERGTKKTVNPKHIVNLIAHTNRADFCAAMAYELFGQCLAFMRLSEMEEAIQRLSNGAIWLSRAAAAAVSEKRSEAAGSGPKKRLISDPRQAAKLEIRKRYDAWREGRVKFKSGAEFARQLDKEFSEVLVGGDATIKNWVSKWDKERKAEREG